MKVGAALFDPLFLLASIILASMSATPEPYLLASTLLTPEELPKLVLVTYDPASAKNDHVASGSTPPVHTQRIFAIISNVSFGVEQSCVLVIKPRRKDPNTAALLCVIPILPELKIDIEPQQGWTASAVTPHNHRLAATSLGLSSLPQKLPTIHTLLESVVPDLLDSKSAGSSNAALKLTLSYGQQAASGVTSDVRGLKDFLSVLKDLLNVAQENAFSTDTTHQWMKAYTDDLSYDTLQQSGAPHLETPMFSRFSHSAFLPSNTHAVGEMLRPASPTSSDMRISVGTFNVNGHLPPDDIPTIIGLKKWMRAEQDPELIVLGFQEVDTSSGAYLYRSPAREDAWIRAVTRALGRRADKYRKIASKQLVGLLILVFAANDLEVDEVATASVGIGLGGFVANKGAVAVRMKVGERTVCFVNSHLSAFDGLQAMERRCWDWSEIYKRLRFRLEAGKVEDFWETPSTAATDSVDANDKLHDENQIKTAQDANDETAVQGRLGHGTLKEQITDGISNEVQAAVVMPTTNQQAQPPPEELTDQVTAATQLDITTDFPPPASPASPPLDPTISSTPLFVEQSIMDHDIVFHFGDLNFRLDLSHSEAHRLIRQRQLDTLYRYDQLESLRTSGSLFDDFLEGRTEDFAPTYKFDKGTDRYDTSEKQRVPAWTDRILWCVTKEWEDGDEQGVSLTAEWSGEKEEKARERQRSQGVMLQAYESVTDLKFSDHRPVRATFIVRIR